MKFFEYGQVQLASAKLCKNFEEDILWCCESEFSPLTEVEAKRKRLRKEKIVHGFNDTMLKIWQERITLLGVIDTGALLASPKALPMRADGRFFKVGLSQAFLEYGLWQDYGTGRETPRKSSAEGELAHTSAEAQPGLRSRNPRDNSGDLGRAKNANAASGSAESIIPQ